MDKHENDRKQTSISLQKEQTPQHQEEDHCSPFCTCNCCAVPMITESSHFDFICFNAIETKFYSFETSDYSFHFASIWQPPKIAASLSFKG
jgi:hypothetical protein